MLNLHLIIIYHQSWVQCKHFYLQNFIPTLAFTIFTILCCQSRDKILYILLVFALYPAMMVDNELGMIYIATYILYILLVFVLYPAMMVGNYYKE